MTRVISRLIDWLSRPPDRFEFVAVVVIGTIFGLVIGTILGRALFAAII